MRLSKQAEWRAPFWNADSLNGGHPEFATGLDCFRLSTSAESYSQLPHTPDLTDAVGETYGRKAEKTLTNPEGVDAGSAPAPSGPEMRFGIRSP